MELPKGKIKIFDIKSLIEKIKLNIKLEEEQEANGVQEQENEPKKKDSQENKNGSEDELSAKHKKAIEEDQDQLDKIGLQNTKEAVSDLREEQNNKKNFKKLKT